MRAPLRLGWLVIAALALAPACGDGGSPTDGGGGLPDGGGAIDDGGDAGGASGDAGGASGDADVDGSAADSGGGGATCGDRIVTLPEECDDGNVATGDGCDASCRREPSGSCGDSIVDRASGEECDDGDTMAGDGCSATCLVEVTASCGDGALEAAAREECDDGNVAPGDGCSPTCQLELVGAFCGDSTLDASEVCDDGNFVNGDGCNPTCNFANTTTLFAGSPGMGGATDGVGTAARFGTMSATGCGASGGMTADNTYVYLGDSTNRRLRRISVATAMVETIAGDGVMRVLDAAAGASASFNGLESITTDGTTIWVADACRIRAVSTTAPYAVTTVAGGPCVPMAMAATITDGVSTAATWSDLRGLAYYGGFVYSLDANAAVLRMFDPVTGLVTTLAGTAGMRAGTDGVGPAARFQSPRYTASDNSGMLYVADTNGASIRAFNTVTRAVSTFAGNGMAGVLDGIGTGARIDRPRGMTSDGTSIYWVEFDQHVIRQGELATQAVTTMLGLAGTPGYVEGVGTAARMRSPFGIAFHFPSESLFWLDGGSCVVRRVQ